MDKWERRREVALKRFDLRERAIQYKGGKCLICHYNRSNRAMEFHHLNPTLKEFTLSGRTSWARIQKELEKCVLLCANCHREVHDGYHPNYLVLDDHQNIPEDYDPSSEESFLEEGLDDLSSPTYDSRDNS